MNPASLSIKRPIFITCLVILMLAVGYLSLKRLPVDLFPNITFPVVVVNTPYRGAGPKEVETGISKVLEEELSSLSGLKTLRSINREGMSTVVAEFTLETDVKYAEQQVRDRVSSAKPKMPKDIEESVIRRVDPADQPILILSLKTTKAGEALGPGDLFSVADEVVKPKLEQVNKVGLVEIAGGRKREIHVALDRKKLKNHEISASQVVAGISAAGLDIPAGKHDEAGKEVVFRTLGEFKSLNDIASTIVSFYGNDVPVTVGDVDQVEDSLIDETSRTYVNGEQSLLLMVFRQTGANTIAVAEAIKKKMVKINEELQVRKGAPALSVVRDGSRMINANVTDVKESIFLGIFLTVVVVFFFLGNGRSTIITGLALPNSLLGAFVLMAAAGFTINIMTLLALSLTVGLLIDDAIVVRENIFRHGENGMDPRQAAVLGTKEVALAVIATTLTVIAVFGPIAFLQGVVGQFFKEFGLTICFAMVISLFDAFTMAPMLSAYFAGARHGEKKSDGIWAKTIGALAQRFQDFQSWLEERYKTVIRFSLRRPGIVILSAIGIFIGSLMLAKFVPKTFLPPQDFGEFAVSLELPPGSSIDAMTKTAQEVDKVLRTNREVTTSVLVVGGRDGEINVANFFVVLVPPKERKVNTSQFKERLRGQLKTFAYAKPVVKDYDAVGAGMRPFNVNIVGSDLSELERVATAAFDKLKNHPALLDVELSHKAGKPEVQVAVDNHRAERLGVSTIQIGQELRTQIEGTKAAIFRENGEDYDIRVRLQEDQRNLGTGFDETFVPNINRSLIRLRDVGKAVPTSGPANINRQDRGRYIQISADIAPKGPGMGGAMKDIAEMFQNEIKLPPGMRYAFVGQAENFQELVQNIILAFGLAILFIFLVLASLYESFITPLAIMLVLPLAICGALIALFVTRTSLDLFSMIGCVMLMGIATKNSILLVDYTNQLVQKGMDRSSALIEAGATRLRPILMTTVALIAGMLPIAIGLNEASKQRTSMGISIIGGLISSTLLSLVVVPATYSYIDRFRVWAKGRLNSVVRG